MTTLGGLRIFEASAVQGERSVMECEESLLDVPMLTVAIGSSL